MSMSPYPKKDWPVYVTVEEARRRYPRFESDDELWQFVSDNDVEVRSRVMDSVINRPQLKAAIEKG